MLRLALAAAAVLAAPAAAQTTPTISDRIGQDGLAATEAWLAEIDTPEAGESFALGGVRFLRAVERTLQARYRSHRAAPTLPMPVLRLPLPENPSPEPFEPAMISGLFEGLIGDMESARAALGAVTGDDDFSLKIDLGDLWFDVNESGVREAGEGLLEIAGGVLDPAGGAMPVGVVVQFDRADVAWLTAYTHMLSGFSELVLAFDPTEVIEDVLASAEAMRTIRGSEMPPPRFGGITGDDERVADLIAMVYGAINRPPDPARTQAARAHLLQVVAENREFWRLVALETDNSAEWIPNTTQTAALGFELPPETGERWMAVLTDAEAVLNGDLLVSHWRTGPTGGVNVARLMEDPPAIDIVEWIQGAGLVAYMEAGPLVSDDSLRRFSALFSGEAILFMVLLN